jgi:1-acyl-sn-glycerol-3-phosphate acyltransferase
MAFPEGKRSNDGRLMEFKGGLFSMAVKVKCPIVPITISHAQAVMPCNALFPVQSGRGKLHVHVHEPIHAVGRSEDELVELVRRAFVSTLPLEQQPLESAARIPADGVPSERGLDERETHHQESVISREVVDSSPVAEVTIELSNVHGIPVPGTSDDPTSEILEMAT